MKKIPKYKVVNVILLFKANVKYLKPISFILFSTMIL